MVEPETTILHIIDPPAWGSSEAELRAFLTRMVTCESEYPGEYRDTIQDTQARIQAQEWEGFPPHGGLSARRQKSPVQLSLFPDLPEQSPPSIIETDEHVLVVCGWCYGSGVEANTSGRVPCRDCEGYGKLLRWIGRAVQSALHPTCPIPQPPHMIGVPSPLDPIEDQEAWLKNYGRTTDPYLKDQVKFVRENLHWMQQRALKARDTATGTMTSQPHPLKPPAG